MKYRIVSLLLLSICLKTWAGQPIVSPDVYPNQGAEAAEFTITSKQHIKALENLTGMQTVEAIAFQTLQERQKITHDYLTKATEIICLAGCAMECGFILNDIVDISQKIQTKIANTDYKNLIQSGGKLFLIFDETKDISVNISIYLANYIPKNGEKIKHNLLDNKEKDDIVRKIKKDLLCLRANLYMIYNLLNFIDLEQYTITPSMMKKFAYKRPEIDIDKLIKETVASWKK